MKTSDIIINFVISFVASVAFYFVAELLKKLKKNVTSNNSPEYDEKYIKNIKLEFYICFSTSSLIMFFKTFWGSDSFSNVFEAVITFFLLLFALFAFMCSIDVINSLSKKVTRDNSDDNDQ